MHPVVSIETPLLVPNFSVTDGFDLPLIMVKIGEKETCALVDSGASLNLISADFFNTCPAVHWEPCHLKVKGIADSDLLVEKRVKLNAVLKNKSFDVDFFVSPQPLAPCYSVIFGFPFLRRNNFCLDARNLLLKSPELTVSLLRPNFPAEALPTDHETRTAQLPPVFGSLPKKVTLPPLSESFVEVVFPKEAFPVGASVLIDRIERNHATFYLAKSVNTVLKNATLIVKLANFSKDLVTLNKHMKVCIIEPVVSHVGESVYSALVDQSPEVSDNFEAWGGDLNLDHLDPPQKEAVNALLREYPHLFAKTVADLEGCDTLLHRIYLKDSVPVRQKPYRTPFHLRAELDKQINELLDAGIIEESDSPYSAPVLFVKKSDGSFRLVTDFRRLNEKTIEDNFPLPNMVELIDNLSGAEFFSTLDLTSGYFQMHIHPDDIHKCAFSTHQGHFQWNRMAFGLRNAPSSFQRLMQVVLSNLQPLQIATYLDDIVVASRTFDEHLDKLRLVFDRLTKHHLKLKPSKCSLIKKEVKYLGFRVTKGQVAPDPSNLNIVESFKVPTTRKQIRQFLGVTGFYRRFIQNYSQIALPLTNLTKESAKFNWNEDAQQAFETLKAELLKQPVLALPDFSKEFTLCTDASKYALGAVLCQRDEHGHLHPVAYASRKLKGPEERYSVVEKEALGVVWGVTHFKHYLLGRHFTVFCDQSSLSRVLKLKDPASRIARWIMTLTQYDYTIIHHPGKLNLTADYLSRAVNTAQVTEISVEPSLQIRIKNEQVHDQKCNKIKDLLKKGDSPKPKNLVFFEKGEILYCTNRNPRNRLERQIRIVVPGILTTEVIEMCHADPTSAHPGLARTLSRTRKFYYWPGMSTQIRRHVLSCHSCVSRRGHIKNPLAPLQRIPIASRPLERVAMDAVGPFPSSSMGNKYIVVVTDYFTRYPEAYPVPNIQSLTIVGVLEKFITTHGIPEIIITDRGSNFISAAISKVYEGLGIKKINTSSFHPQSDGVCERLNGVLINSLSHLVSNTHEDWCRHVPFALLAHRTTIHSATGETPAFLLYGRDLTLPTELLSQPPQRSYSEIQEYVADLSFRLRTSFATVKQNLGKAADRQENQRSKIAKDKGIRVGDVVYCHFPNLGAVGCRKFAKYNKGPFRVLKQTSPVNYEIQAIDRPAAPIRVHVDRLRKIPVNYVTPQLPEEESISTEQRSFQRNGYNLRPRRNGFVR